jgi:hypothetical protein
VLSFRSGSVIATLARVAPRCRSRKCSQLRRAEPVWPRPLLEQRRSRDEPQPVEHKTLLQASGLAGYLDKRQKKIYSHSFSFQQRIYGAMIRPLTGTFRTGNSGSFVSSVTVPSMGPIVAAEDSRTVIW